MVEPDLREVFLGDWDGGEYRFRAAANALRLSARATRANGVRIPGAESTAALHDRVSRGLRRIAATHPDQPGCGGGARRRRGGGPCGGQWSGTLRVNGAANGSISRIVIHEERMIIRGFNDVAHL